MAQRERNEISLSSGKCFVVRSTARSRFADAGFAATFFFDAMDVQKGFSDLWRVSKPGQVFRAREVKKTWFLQKEGFSGVMTPPLSVDFLKSWVLWQAKIEKALCLRQTRRWGLGCADQMRISNLC